MRLESKYTCSCTFLFFPLKSLFAMLLHPPHPLSSSPHLFPLSIIHKRKKVHGIGKGWGYEELNEI